MCLSMDVNDLDLSFAGAFLLDADSSASWLFSTLSTLSMSFSVSSDSVVRVLDIVDSIVPKFGMVDPCPVFFTIKKGRRCSWVDS